MIQTVDEVCMKQLARGRPVPQQTVQSPASPHHTTLHWRMAISREIYTLQTVIVTCMGLSLQVQHSQTTGEHADHKDNSRLGRNREAKA